MQNPRAIRGEFIRNYAERHQKMVSDGWRMISSRDAAHRALNQKFGFSEPDGSFNSGCKSHVNRDYKRAYDQIEARFRVDYDTNLPAFYDWCRHQGITIFEYLFADNIDVEDLNKIAEISTLRQDWELEPINLKAHLSVENLKADHRVGEIRNRVNIEIGLHHFARSRCRTFFGIRPWDIFEQKAIFDYRRKWTTALDLAFDKLSVA